MRRFHFIIVVWGAGHTGVFLDVGLPSLVAPGNLPGIQARSRSRFHLFTRSGDLTAMEAAPAFQRLRTLLPIDIELMDDWFDGSGKAPPHALMSRAHREGLRRACELGADAVFIPPECVWADGSLVNLERIAARGARMVHISGLRLVLEEAVPKLVAGWRSADGSTLAIPARELVRLGLPHLHPITKDTFFREHGTRMMPANLLWTVGDEGILARCFHLHPLLVEPSERNATFRTTIDDDLSLVSADDGSRDYVVGDSDEIFVFELSGRHHRVMANYLKGSVAEIAAWAEVGMNARHRELVETPIRLHAGDMTPALWQPIEAEAEQVVRGALALVDQPTASLLGRYDNNLGHRVLAARYRGMTIADWVRAEGIAIEALPPQIQVWGFQESGDARRAEGDLEGAAAEYGKAIRASGITAMPHWMRGTARAELGDLEGALADFTAGLALEPDNAALAFRRDQIRLQLCKAQGQALRAADDLAGAVARYDEAITAEPGDITLYYLRGTARAALGELEGALADFEAGLALDPGNAALAFLREQTRFQLCEARGQALRAAGDLAGAIARYGEAITAGPPNVALYYLRGTARAALGELEGALADFEAGLTLAPDNVALKILFSQVRFKLVAAAFQASGSDPATAIARYDGAIRAGQADPALYYLRGTVRAELGTLEDALADFEAGLALEPDNAALAFMREHVKLQLCAVHARALHRRGDLAGAIARYDEAIQSSRPNASLHYLRGTTLMELGDDRAALADFEAGLALDPENPTLMFLRDLMRARLAAPPLPVRLFPWTAVLARRVVGVSDRILGRIFGLGAQVRPWHWRWPYVNEVVRPFIRALAASSGDVLLVENDELPLAGLLADLPVRPALTAWSPAELRAFLADRRRRGERPERFDRVVCRSPLSDRHWPEVVEALGQVLRPGGELLLVIPGREAAQAGKLLGERLPDFRLLESRPQGSLGTAVVTTFCNRLRGTAWVRRAQSGAGTLGRVFLAPPILLLYPLLSLLAALLNLFGRPRRIGLEAVLTLRKAPAAVVSNDGRAAVDGSPGLSRDDDPRSAFRRPRHAWHSQ